ncbi:MAG: LamG-like jellyroll fold domain-containing protein [Patescibacteria group bacterium]
MGFAAGGGIRQVANAAFVFKRAATIEYSLNLTALAIVTDGTVGTNITYTLPSNTKYVAANITNGAKSNFYVNGLYIGDSSSNLTLTPSNQAVRLGNFVDTVTKVSAVLIINRPLTATEHSALFSELSAATWPALTRCISYVDTKPRVPDTGLVAAWDFGALQNGKVVDLTGHGYDATAFGVVTEQTPWGRGVRGNGTSSYLQTGNVDLSTTDKVTVVMVAKPRDLAVSAAMVELSTGFPSATDGLALYGGSSNVNAGLRGNTGTCLASTAAMTSGVPLMIVGVFDKSLATNECTVYLNGFDATATRTDLNNTNLFGNKPFYFLARGGASLFSNAWLKSCAVYNRAFTAAEVRATWDASGLKSAGWSTDFGVPVSVAARGGTAGQQLETTDFKFLTSTPRYSVATSTISGTVVKTISCSTAGPLFLGSPSLGQTPTEAAYGQWSCWFNKSAGGVIDWMPVASDKIAPATAGNNGYLLRIDASEKVWFYKNNGVTLTQLFATGNDYIVASTWYGLRLARSYAGAWTLQIIGGAFTGWTTVGGATNNDYVVSGYQIWDVDSSDLLSIGSCCGKYQYRKSIA